MAKTKAAPAADPSTPGGVPDLSSPLAPEVSTAAAPEVSPARELRTIALEIAYLPGPPAGYVSNHVERRLSPRQALGLRRYLDGLQQRGAKLADGRRVDTGAAAIGYFLEQIPGESDD